MSITSTCYALKAVLAANEESLYDSVINLEMSPFVDENDDEEEESGDKIQARAIIQELLKAEWRDDDLFQVPLLLNTILEVDSSRSVIGEKIRKDLAPKVCTSFGLLLSLLLLWKNYYHNRCIHCTDPCMLTLSCHC